MLHTSTEENLCHLAKTQKKSVLVWPVLCVSLSLAPAVTPMDLLVSVK